MWSGNKKELKRDWVVKIDRWSGSQNSVGNEEREVYIQYIH